MRDKKKWGALVLTVIMVASLALSGCRREREKIEIGTEQGLLTSTESESETNSEKATEQPTEQPTEAPTETEPPSTEAPNTQNPTTGNSDNTGSTGNTGNNDNSGNTGNSGGTDNTGNTGNSGGTDNTGNTGSTGTETPSTTVTETEAPRYFYDANGNRVDVTQQPDGSWRDANGVSYIFFENGVQDSNGTQYYYDPPQTGLTGGVEVGEQADFYDSQGNHIVCTMDENGNWVDAEGNVYHFGLEGVTDYMGNFHPY